ICQRSTRRARAILMPMSVARHRTAMSSKTQELREEAPSERTHPRYIVGQGEEERRKSLRYVVASTRDLQFLHTAAQGIGMHVEDLGAPMRPFDAPACLA